MIRAKRACAEKGAAVSLEGVRSLIERVVLHPSPGGQRGFEIELVGEISAMGESGSR